MIQTEKQLSHNQVLKIHKKSSAHKNARRIYENLPTF